MAEIADKLRLQRTLKTVQAAADWERAATMLTRAEYDQLMAGLQALAAAIDVLTPALPEELQP